MDTSKKTKTLRIVIFALIVIGIVLLMRLVVRATKADGKYDTFAQCLAAKDIKFYGAFWCPHCQQQEQWLGASRQKLATEGLYVECSTPDAKSQTKICVDNNITGYPTWVFPDGTRLTGEQKLADLAAKSGCALPAESTGPSTTQSSSTVGTSSAVQQ